MSTQKPRPTDHIIADHEAQLARLTGWLHNALAAISLLIMIAIMAFVAAGLGGVI